MGATHVFLGVRQAGTLTCFETWTRDYVCEDDPYILLGRVLPPLARLGLDRVARLLLDHAAEGESEGELGSAVEYWLEALEDGVDLKDLAGVIEPQREAFACGVVIDMDVRAVDWLRPGAALTDSVERRGIDVHGFVAALRTAEAKLNLAGKMFERIMEARFAGALGRPTAVDWEIQLMHDDNVNVLPSPPAASDDDDDDDDDVLPPGYVQHDLYAISMFFASTADTLIVTGRKTEAGFEPTWATIAAVGEPCAILVEPGAFEVWEQTPAPPVDPDFGIDTSELLRSFDQTRARCVQSDTFTVDPDDTDGPDLSFITASLTMTRDD
jgi:hypothetical protein